MLEMANVEVEITMGRVVVRAPQYVTLKSMAHYIAALVAKFDKFNIPNDDDDDDSESSKEEEGTPNHSTSALTCQSKKSGRS
jgi:hypothetical protein